VRGTKYRRARRRDGRGGRPVCRCHVDSEHHAALSGTQHQSTSQQPKAALCRDEGPPPKLKLAAIVAGTALLIIGLPRWGPGIGQLGGTWTSWHAAGAST
jgi:hypothetical protein